MAIGHAATTCGRATVMLVAVVALALPAGAAAAPFELTDINPDASIIAQGRNNSQGGRVNALKVVPGGNQVAYAASEWGGLYKTSDGAQSWTHLDGHEPQATFDVDVDPSDTDTVYATSLFDGRDEPRSGILVSRDAGQTWEHPTVPDTASACASWSEPSAFGIGVAPDDPSNVVIGTACGVAVSQDAGVTWTHADPDPGTNARRIWDVVAQPGGLFDICGSDGHFRSADGGASWTPSTLADAGDVCSIAASPLESDVLFVTQNNVALWETSDGGLSWTMLEDRPGNRRAFVETNQTGAGSFDLYFGSGPKLRLVAGCDDSSLPTRCPAAADLTDGATYGTDITGNAHDDAGDLEFDPTDAVPRCPYLYSNDGGVYRSDDCAPTWQRAMVGLHDTWLFDMTAAPLANDQTGLYFGLMDSGGWYSTDGGASWGGPTCCDIWDVMADAERVIFTQCCPTTVMRVAPADDPSNISPMTPPPSGWLQWFQQTDSMQPFADDSYVVITQTAGNARFETPGGNGPGGVWITEDAGGSYTQLGAASTPANACSVQVAVEGTTPTFYVLTDDQLNGSPSGLCSGGGGQLFKYTGTDPGGTWLPADTGLTKVGVFGVHPADADRLYASDLTASGPRMVSSDDGGASWEPDVALDALMTGDGAFRYSNAFGPQVRWFTPPLAGYDQPTMVAFHPTDPDVLIAGATDAGLFVSTDGGDAWARVTRKLPRVWHRAFDPYEDSVFYVGTVGRGVWKVRLPDGDLSIDQGDDPEPAVAGEQLTYTLTVENEGPDPVPGVRVVDTLPEGLQYVTDDAGCEETQPGTVTCALGTLDSGDVREIEIVVAVPADFVHENGPGPVAVTNSATVAGVTIDPDTTDNATGEDTDIVAVADLEVLSFDALAPPAELLVGQPAQITLRSVVTHHGPSAPMDAVLETDATASPGTTVVPAQQSAAVAGLDDGEGRVVEQVFTIECQEASNHSFTFGTELRPEHPADSDPDPSNDTATVQLDVICVVPVAINVKPGGEPNPVNPKSHGVIPVAVLTTAVGEYGLPLAFDATTIDPLSVRFGPRDEVLAETGGAFETHGRGHLEDSLERDELTRDGDPDMVLHFRTQETGLGPLHQEACAKGEWVDGQGDTHLFFGCDAITGVPAA